ncbi:MAG: serine/threonine-protein kinase [Gemmatimonadota bacterium]
MTGAARWARVSELLNDALARDGSERAAFLDEACGSDEELRAEVEELLATHEASPAFLEMPFLRIGAPEAAPPDAGTRVGPYRLIRPLGRGGMGEVHLAVHEGADFQRHVALKVIRRGLDTEDVMARFRSERRILATLRHPNIATLVDGGTTDDGRPFFAMEYIEGLPLDVFCDERRLSVGQRLALFRRVCEAVHHAHQNLVVHRDLKPSNILVTEDGTPKLLDFGIARLLAASDPGHTRVQGPLLTPEYASPEHIAGEAVTTASDVYSLGVVLYELLTGRRPLDASTLLADVEVRPPDGRVPTKPSEAVNTRLVRRRPDGSQESLTPEDVSARRADTPTRLRRRLSGDLDTIVLRALSTEPSRRYHSAQALADDLERYQEGLPILARPDTLTYRLATFTRRHRLAVASGTALLLMLVGATALSLAQSRRIASEAERVRAERDKALEVRSFLIEMFGTTGAGRAAGDSLTAGALLDRTMAGLDGEYAAEPAILAEMQEVLAEGYRRMGRLERADSLARASLALREELLGSEHPDVAAALGTLGLILRDRGLSDKAEPLLRRAVALRRGTGADRLDDLARSLNDLGLVLVEQARYDEAAAAYTESLAVRRAAHPGPHRGIAVTTSNLAALRYTQGRYDEAVSLGQQALAALRGTVGPDHQRSLVAQQNLAVMRDVAGDRAGAAAEYRDVLARRQRVLGADHPDLVASHQALATTLLAANQAAEAEQHARRALSIVQRSLPQGGSRSEEAEALSWVARTVAAQDRLEEALDLQTQAMRILRAFYPDGHPSVAQQANALAQQLRTMRRYDAAVNYHQEAVAVAERTQGEDHPQTLVYAFGLGQTLLERGDASAAVPHLGRALDGLTRSLGEQHDVVFAGLLVLAQAEAARGDTLRADSLLAVASERIPEGDAGRSRRARLERARAQVDRKERGPSAP